MLRPCDLSSGTMRCNCKRFVPISSLLCYLLGEWDGWKSNNFLGLWARRPHWRNSGVKSLKEPGSYATFGSIIPALNCLPIKQVRNKLLSCFKPFTRSYYLILTDIHGLRGPNFLTLFYMSLSLLTGTLATLAHAKLFAAFNCSLQSWLLSLE